MDIYIMNMPPYGNKDYYCGLYEEAGSNPAAKLLLARRIYK
jgi:hypothetical protein